MSAISPVRTRIGWSRPVAMLLATIALLVITALASWHDARPHMHDMAGTTITIGHDDHHPDGGPQPGDPLHAAAHVVLQGIAIPAGPAIAAAAPALPLVWTMAVPAPVHSIPPGSILRPPRA